MASNFPSQEISSPDNCDISQAKDRFSESEFYSRGSYFHTAFGGHMKNTYGDPPPGRPIFGLHFQDIPNYKDDHAGRLHIYAT